MHFLIYCAKWFLKTGTCGSIVDTITLSSLMERKKLWRETKTCGLKKLADSIFSWAGSFIFFLTQNEVFSLVLQWSNMFVKKILNRVECKINFLRVFGLDTTMYISRERVKFLGIRQEKKAMCRACECEYFLRLDVIFSGGRTLRLRLFCCKTFRRWCFFQRHCT